MRLTFTPAAAESPDLRATLRRRFGHDAFRPGQEEAIRALLDGRDVLSVLPTGAGKSLIYQLAAQLLPGPTVVVSPLLALMQDQVESLEEQGIGVGFVNSTLTARQAERELEEVQEATAKLLYVTPERFADEAFIAETRELGVSLLVVDEAHCISEWGHSFRPAYLALGEVAERLGRPVVLALTATATPWVRRDIVARLGMRDPAVLVRGSDRPSLFLEVLRVEEEAQDRRALERLFREPVDARRYGEALAAELTEAMSGSGIVYTATTRAARETAGWLQAWGIAADYYHGQRRIRERERVQDAFMSGAVRVICATNAFGLGVDKPDVRFVVHRDVPASVEAYYQEAGRAGRDGRLARCVLLYRPGDLGRAAFLAATGHLQEEHVSRALEALRDAPEQTARGLTASELRTATGLGQGNASRLIDLLERSGLVVASRGRLRLRRPEATAAAVSLEAEARRLAYERSRLEMMGRYADLSTCRREFVLSYFGETFDPAACTLCDNSVRPRVASGHGEALPDAATAATTGARSEARATEARLGDGLQRDGRFGAGARVAHRAWGEGTVQRLAGDAVTVLFDAAGYKTLALPGALQRNLLTKADGAAGGADAAGG